MRGSAPATRAAADVQLAGYVVYDQKLSGRLFGYRVATAAVQKRSTVIRGRFAGSGGPGTRRKFICERYAPVPSDDREWFSNIAHYSVICRRAVIASGLIPSVNDRDYRFKGFRTRHSVIALMNMNFRHVFPPENDMDIRLGARPFHANHEVGFVQNNRCNVWRWFLSGRRINHIGVVAFYFTFTL